MESNPFGSFGFKGIVAPFSGAKKLFRLSVIFSFFQLFGVKIRSARPSKVPV